MRLMLGALELTYVIKDEVLLITTKEKADAELVTKAYPVADLVIPIRSMAEAWAADMGGGIWRWHGRWHGGHGRWNGWRHGRHGWRNGWRHGEAWAAAWAAGCSRPRRTTGRRLPGFRRAGRLEIDAESKARGESRRGNQLETRGRAPPAAKSAAPNRDFKNPRGQDVAGRGTTNPGGKAAKVGAIQLPAGASNDPEVAWNDYFSSHPDAKPEAVRETIRQRMHERKFNEVIGLIRAALRAGQPQPWMYEALGLAMQASGSSKAEIERALMSAIDLGDSTEDFLYVAQYMARIGLESRALKVFRQVSVVEPLRPEPYVYGLQLAQRVDDLDGLRWSCLGILRQEWPKDKHDVAQSGTTRPPRSWPA